MANAVQSWLVNNYDQIEAPGATLGGVRADSVVDQIAALFSAIFLHVRGLPMFSTLLGFGIGLIVASMHRKRYPVKDTRRTLARRYGFLALFGLIHMFGLFHGDIMFIYGAIGVVMACLITLSSTWLRVIAYSILVVYSLITGAFAAMLYFLGESLGESLNMQLLVPPAAELPTLGIYLQENAVGGLLMLANTPFAIIQLGALVMIGYVWAREGYLANPDEHRGVLLRWIVLGAVVAFGIGVPWGLSAIGVLTPQLELPLYIMNQALGALTGPAILAAIALAVNGAQQRMAANGGVVPGWAYPFVALGKRSMSGYLAQSLLFVVLVMPFGFGWGLEASISGKLVVGATVWLITLVIAVVLERTGTPGPFEKLHRRLAYGPTGKIEPYRVPLTQAAAQP